LFYDFIDRFNTPIIIIGGNHENITKTTTTFDFIPQVNYLYVKLGVLKIKDKAFHLVEHNNIDKICSIDILEGYKNYLFSHYRSAIKFAPAEVNNMCVSKRFEYVVLSDIHFHFKPYYNIEYTSSPTSIKFEPLTENGFINVLLEDTPVFEFNELKAYKKVRFDVDKSNFKMIVKKIEANRSWLFKLFVDKEFSEKEINKLRAYDNVYTVVVSEDNIKEVDLDRVIEEVKEEAKSNNLLAIIDKLLVVDDIREDVVKECRKELSSLLSSFNKGV